MFSKIAKWYSDEETQSLLKIYGIEQTDSNILGFRNFEQTFVELDDPYIQENQFIVASVALIYTKKDDLKISKKDLRNLQRCTIDIFAFSNSDNKKKFLRKNLKNAIEINNPYIKEHPNRIFNNLSFYYVPQEAKIIIIPKNDQNIPTATIKNWIDEDETQKWFQEDGYESVWLDTIGINSVHAFCHTLTEFYSRRKQEDYILTGSIDLGILPYYRHFRKIDIKILSQEEVKLYLEPSSYKIKPDKEQVQIINNFTEQFPKLEFWFKTSILGGNEWSRSVEIYPKS